MKSNVRMIGRKREIRELRRAYDSSASEFVAVYGRRRIGKTYLINEVFGAHFAFHAAGIEGERKKASPLTRGGAPIKTGRK